MFVDGGMDKEGEGRRKLRCVSCAFPASLGSGLVDENSTYVTIVLPQFQSIRGACRDFAFRLLVSRSSIQTSNGMGTRTSDGT